MEQETNQNALSQAEEQLHYLIHVPQFWGADLFEERCILYVRNKVFRKMLQTWNKYSGYVYLDFLSGHCINSLLQQTVVLPS